MCHQRIVPGTPRYHQLTGTIHHHCSHRELGLIMESIRPQNLFTTIMAPSQCTNLHSYRDTHYSHATQQLEALLSSCFPSSHQSTRPIMGISQSRHNKDYNTVVYGYHGLEDPPVYEEPHHQRHHCEYHDPQHSSRRRQIPCPYKPCFRDQDGELLL